MPRTPFLLALLAALMLIFGGAPVRAAAPGCEDCPPDCPMMAQMDAAGPAADHHAPTPTKGGDMATYGCEHGLPCPPSAGVLAALPTGAAEVAAPASRIAVLRPLEQLPAASRPPDRTLRPPIQL